MLVSSRRAPTSVVAIAPHSELKTFWERFELTGAESLKEGWGWGFD